MRPMRPTTTSDGQTFAVPDPVHIKALSEGITVLMYFTHYEADTPVGERANVAISQIREILAEFTGRAEAAEAAKKEEPAKAKAKSKGPAK